MVGSVQKKIAGGALGETPTIAEKTPERKGDADCKKKRGEGQGREDRRTLSVLGGGTSRQGKKGRSI